MENKKWILVCLLGGILMVIGSVIGSTAFFATLFELASKYVNKEVSMVLTWILVIFSYVSLGGGISVILGAIIAALNHYKLGKLAIALGAGLGLIGLIIFVITGIIAGTLVSSLAVNVFALIALNGGFGFAGVLLTILGRRKLKHDKEGKKEVKS